MNVPNHVAIILDGNGRWAKAKGMPRNYGHVQGAKTVEVICEEAYRMGIQYLTVYAFSTENWKRPADEVDALMKLLRNYMKTCLKTAAKNNMCVRVIGDKSGLDEDIRTRIDQLEEATKDNTGLHFQIALNYGGRDELRRAFGRLAAKAVQGQLDPDSITEDDISNAWIRREFRIRICSSVPAVSSGFPISCCGSWPIRNFTFHQFRGRILQKKNWSKLSKHIIIETEDTGW